MAVVLLIWWKEFQHDQSMPRMTKPSILKMTQNSANLAVMGLCVVRMAD